MPPSMAQIRQSDLTRWPTPTKIVVENPPAIPTGVVATGQQGIIRVQWSPQVNVEGYDIAIMTAPNLANPDVNIARAHGAKNREYVYPMGNSATTRYFAVRAYLDDVYSDWSSIVNATSVVFAAVEAAPPTPPANPPSSYEPPPTGSGDPGSHNYRIEIA
jgi:hypothetical protein